nr:putative ribonuclease H-like domain-containing protein [Tanacetum cinerariifolium]
MENYDTVPTFMVEQAKLKLDLVGKPVNHTDYRSMIGSLMYVTSSRPDIMFTTCMCARYQANPNEHHVSAIKKIFHYFKGTINLGLWYLKYSGFDLTAFSEADHAGCHLDRKSRSDSAESEYVAVSGCCAQVLWVRTQLTDYGFFYDKVPIYYDSKSAIAILCNPVQHTRTKHIDVRGNRLKVADSNVDYESQKIPIENKKESRASKYQDNRNREAPRRTLPVEVTTSNALVSQYDRLGYDWSDQVEDGPTNFALMVHTSSSSSNSSNSYSEYNLGAYKPGLESVEARLEVYKKNEVVFTDDIKILKLDVMLRDKAITELRQKFKKAKKERVDLKLTLEKFQDSSKNLSRLLDSQQSDKSKTGLGYLAVPPPYTGNFMPPKPDLVFADKHVVSESVTSLPNIVKSKVKTNETQLKNVIAPIVEDWVFDSKDEHEIETESNQIKPSFAKVKFVKPIEHVKSLRKSVKKEENNRQTKYPRKNSQSPRDCDSYKKKKMVEKPVWNNARRANLFKSNNIYPRTTVNGAKPSLNVFQQTYSPVRRTFNQRTTPKNSDLKEKVNTVTGKVTTVGIKPVISVVDGNGENGNPQYTLHDQGIFDSGCSRHMTGNKSFLTDYQEFDGGFVAFEGSPKRGKIYRKGKTRTGKLDFEDVYFVKELKFNLFSVSQMCDKKNSVLFTKTECLILSPDFKLLDENQVLLKVSRQNNMYSFDLKKCCSFSEMNKFCQMKGIKREFSVAKTPQQNGVAEKKNRTLIEAGRTMLVDSLLPTTFLAKAVNTACYVQNRVLATKLYNKTPYELLLGRSPNIGFMKPFGCPVTILNTLYHLGKIEGKADEGFLVRYSVNSKAFRVFNSRTRKLEENLHIKFLENKPIVAGRGSEWFFDIDSLTISMNYKPFTTGNQTNHVGIMIHDNAGQAGQEKASDNEYILLPFMPSLSTQSSYDKDADEVPGKGNEGVSKGNGIDDQERTDSSTQDVNTAGLNINTTNTNINTSSLNINTVGSNDPKADTNNLELSTVFSLIPTTRVHKDHPKKQIIGDLNLATQTRRMINFFEENAMDRSNQVILAYASFMGFIVYQMDVKSVFLYDTIEDEVYVCQPPDFEDPYFPDKVYKVEKALYGLHQAPRAWYETLSTYLLENGFSRGTIDKTLFIKKDKDDILLVQIKQKDNGIFISQDKYVADILKKFIFSSVKTASTPMEPNKALIKDAEAKDVDVHLYRSMIGSLMYLIASRHDIMFVVCACARFQVTPKISHLHVVKRIFRYLKGQPKLSLWYLRDSPFDLEAFSNSDYARASLDRKYTTGGCQFLGKRLISWQCKKQTIVVNSTTKAEYVVAASCCRQVSQDETPTEEHIPTPSHDLLPSGKDRLQLNELMEICTKLSDMVLSLDQIKTNQVAKIEKLKKRVKKLEGKKKKRTHGLNKLYKVGLAARVESSKEEEGLGDQEDASKQGRIAEIDANEDLPLINESAQDQGRMNDEDLFGVNDLDGDEVIVDVTAGENVEQDATVAEKRTTSSSQPSQLPHAKDKGKGIIVEPKKPLKKKDQIVFDEEVARKLDAQMKAKMEEEERIARDKDEANKAMIEE